MFYNVQAMSLILSEHYNNQLNRISIVQGKNEKHICEKRKRSGFRQSIKAQCFSMAQHKNLKCTTAKLDKIFARTSQAYLSLYRSGNDAASKTCLQKNKSIWVCKCLSDVSERKKLWADFSDSTSSGFVWCDSSRLSQRCLIMKTLINFNQPSAQWY